VNGILLLDKPAGLSSNAALQRVRRMAGADKAGHVGSLDPLATGMLPICLDEATKVAGEIISSRKAYRFTVALGSRTSTGDLEGTVVEQAPVPALDAAMVEEVLRQFRGSLQQVPPMYSALKRDGQPLYRLARAGIEVERAARQIEIFNLELHGIEGQFLDLSVRCSKGTYVRVLGEDIARRLGSCGHLSALRRSYVEPFEGQPMVTLEDVEALSRAGHALPLIPADHALPGLPAVRLPPAEAARVLQGQRVPFAGCEARGRVRLYGTDGGFMGLGEVDERAVVRPRRLLRVP